MNFGYKNIALLTALVTLLTGCWKQHDVISIKSDGSTTFRSDIVITEKGFSINDIEELTSEFMKELESAGWKVEKKWISKTEPFKLSFSGQGNIRQIENAVNFYEIQQVNESTFSIRFVPAEMQGGKSSRSIEFVRGFLGGAKIVDGSGNEVKEIENVLESNTYKIVL